MVRNYASEKCEEYLYWGKYYTIKSMPGNNFQFIDLMPILFHFTEKRHQNIELLLKDFPLDMLYYHSIKLSQWNYTNESEL